jgi:hypothetical protein
MKNKKRIAFGFFGQTRVSDVINVWYKRIEKDYDFFMSTWNDENSQKLNFDFIKINKCNYDDEIQKIKKDIPDKVFDKDTKTLSRIKKVLAQAYMFFHTNNVINSIKKYEKENNFKYDVIFLCRPDNVVKIEDLKLQINRFLRQSNFNRPMISTQSPIILNDLTFTLANNMAYILNNQALDYILNLRKELFEDRLDLDIKFSYRGDHETIPFMVVKHNFLSVVNGLESRVIRTPQEFDERYGKL